ncbi:hypothetical protein [Ligilactobacillus animalis]
MDRKKGIDDMKKFTKKERSQLNTCLEKVITEEDGIYIPTRVMKSNKLTFEQKQLYGLLCMQASSTGVVANGTHLVYILGGLTAEVTKDLERLKKLGYIAPVIKSIGFCKYEVTYWNILNIDDVEKVKRKMLKEG